MFISVKLIDWYSITNIRLPVVSRGELKQRVNDFIQKRGHKNFNKGVYSHLYKKLFQNNSCELAAFPERALEQNSVSCGDLMVCALSLKKGVVLCFIPSTEAPFPRRVKMMKQFQGKNYPNCNEASTCFLSKSAISFLAYEEGMIDTDKNGSCTLQKFEVSLLRHNNKYQTLFCKKITSTFVMQSPSYIMGETRSNYVLVDCVCGEKDFSFQIGIPVYSQEEVAAKVSSARQLRAASLKLKSLREEKYLRFAKIFPKRSVTHHVISLPDPMFLSLPFGIIKKGKLLLSQTKNGCILELKSISDLFVSGDAKPAKHSVKFHDWQVGSPSYMQTNAFIQHINCFSDLSVTIARKGDSKEFFVVGAKIKLICSLKGIWAVCFVREGGSSLVMEQGPSHEAQSISDCDPDEGPSSHGAKAISDCDPDEGPSSHGAKAISDCDPDEGPSSHGAKAISDCDPDEGPSSHGAKAISNCDPAEGFSSHGLKKRSAACLELTFAEQHSLWSSRWNSEEETPQDAKNRSRACLGLKCADQDPLWSSNWDPEEDFSHGAQSSSEYDSEEEASSRRKK